VTVVHSVTIGLVMSSPEPSVSNARPDIATYGSSRLAPDEALALAHEGDGLVLPGGRGLVLARRLRNDYGYVGKLWLDAIRYLPANGEDRPVQLGLFDRWPHDQQALRVTEMVTAPEAVIEAGDDYALCQTLAEDLPTDGRVLLALESDWLVHRTTRLAERIIEFGRPVALSLRAANDPLAKFGAVPGLVAVVDAVPDLRLFRIDSSGLGAASRDLRGIAIGVNTYTRHVPSRRSKSGGNDKPQRPRGTDVFITSLCSHHQDIILQMLDAVGTARLGGLDLCWCHVCNGRSLLRFAYSSLPREGRAHDQAVLSQLAKAMLRLPDPDRTSWWSDLCNQAVEAHLKLRTDHQVSLRPPAALKQWAKLL
jgi:hypothetical protein